jgi:hypothetical protein
MTDKNPWGLSSGKWLVSDCGNYPSEINCKLVIAAPVAQKAHLMDAVVDHAVKVHQEQDTLEVRKEFEKALEEVEV